MADITFTCRGYVYGGIGELEYELDRRIGPVMFNLVNFPDDPSPAANKIKVTSTGPRTAVLEWKRTMDEGTYSMALYVVNQDGDESPALIVDIVVDRSAAVKKFGQLIGTSVAPLPVNRIHTLSHDFVNDPVATASAVYSDTTARVPSFSLVNSHKSTKNYTIDDTTGEIFLDASSNPAVVTALNTSNLVATTDFFTFGDTLPELGSGDFTLNIFFKFTSFAEDFPLLFSKWLNPSGRSIQVYYYVANETMSFAYSTTGSNTNTITVPYTATLDTWAMFTGVRSGGDFLMYINGVQIGTTQSISGTIFDTATDWRLSGYAGATEVAVLGSLVYPKVYNKALIAAEVVELYNDGDPKCYDDLSVDLKDSLLYAPPLSNDGTNIGDELIDPAASVTTVNNGAVAFDEDGISEECTPEPITEITALNTASLNGTSQYFQTTNLVDTTAAWSIVMRVKFNAVSTGEAQTLYSDYAQSTNLSGVVLRQWYNTSKFVVSVDNNTLHISHTVDLVADKWYMLGASYDSVTGYKIVINDTIETNASQLATDVTTLTHIGAIDHPIVQAFGGSISHYFVYDKALSNANFIELYNDIDGTGTPKCYADLSTDLKTSLVAAWSLSNTGTPGGETIDLSGNGNDLTAVGSPTYTGSGLSEDCAGGGGGDTPDDGTIHEVGYRVKDSINTFQGVVKFIYKDTAFTGGTS